jgi:uncharacterized protein YprB with RNaseH-like and TPR domain
MEDGGARVLLWDIETTWGLTPDDTHLLCIAWAWLGEDEVSVASIDEGKWPKDLRDERHILESFLPEFNRADNLVTWYGRKFDEPYIRAKAARYRMDPLRLVHHDDLWYTCRHEFSLSSNRLENAAEFLGVAHEKEKLSKYVWHDAEFGDQEALDKIKYRCVVDVLLLEDVYEIMLPYIRGKFNIATAQDRIFACPWCGSEDVVRNGKGYSNVTVWQKYKCNNCGAWPKGPSHGRSVGKLR